MSILSILFLGARPEPVLAQAGQSAKKIRVDLEAASDGKVSQYVESVQFIPLERSKASQFRSIFQLETTDGYFVILDKENNTILIFTRAGAFHATIKVDGSIYQFRVDKKANQIEIDKYPETLVYNLDGGLIRKDAIGDRPSTMFGVTKRDLDQDHAVYFNTSMAISKDSPIYQLMVYQDGRLTNHFLPYPKDYKLEPFDNMGMINFSSNLNDADTGVYYIRDYDYTVYRLTPHSITAAYQFIFPVQNSIPRDFVSDSSYNGKRMAFFVKDENQAVIPRLYRFYKDGDHLFFSEGRYSYIFDTKTQQLICVNRLVPDSLSYFLPLTDTEVDKFKKSFYLNFDGSYFYFFCSSDILYDQKESGGKGRVRYPPELIKFFSNGKNRTEGNPVLVQVKFKNAF